VSTTYVSSMLRSHLIHAIVITTECFNGSMECLISEWMSS